MANFDQKMLKMAISGPKAVFLALLGFPSRPSAPFCQQFQIGMVKSRTRDIEGLADLQCLKNGPAQLRFEITGPFLS